MISVIVVALCLSAPAVNCTFHIWPADRVLIESRDACVSTGIALASQLPEEALDGRSPTIVCGYMFGNLGGRAPDGPS